MNRKNSWDQKTEIGKSSGRGFLRGNNNCNEENQIRESIWTFRGEHVNDKCKWESWN